MEVAQSGLGVNLGGSDNAVTAINGETTRAVVKCACKLISDGNLDTRTSAKNIFRQVIHHPEFERVIVEQYISNIYRDNKEKLNGAKKHLKQLK